MIGSGASTPGPMTTWSSRSASPLPAGTGVATARNFEATGDGQAAITGDFAMVPDEVQGVLGALRTSGIEVTALHSHMLMATSPG